MFGQESCLTTCRCLERPLNEALLRFARVAEQWPMLRGMLQLHWQVAFSYLAPNFLEMVDEDASLLLGVELPHLPAEQTPPLIHLEALRHLPLFQPLPHPFATGIEEVEALLWLVVT